MARELYNELASKLKDISRLGAIAWLLWWDEETFMPPGAADARGLQKEVLAGVIHEKKTSADLGLLIEKLATTDVAELDDFEKANVRDARREYLKLVRVPAELEKRKARLESEAYQAWTKAREKSDFTIFSPYLKEWVSISREIARYIDPDQPAYDVLMDKYERGMTSARLDELFAELAKELKPLRDLIVAAYEPHLSVCEGFIKPPLDQSAQVALCNQVARDLGFDTACGRLDVSVHPFSVGIHRTDVRMTTSYSETNLINEALGGTIHETGHSLYEQACNPDHTDLPVSLPLSMGIHESQSLLWERHVALSEPFFEHYLPLLTEKFPLSFAANPTPRQLCLAANAVRNSFIRIVADEVTYPFHIMLRLEIEKDLISGELQVDDVPRVWNEKFEHYFGLVPPNDANGCLQDVHWAHGSFGYFPTYVLGALAAAQLFAAANTAIPDLAQHISRGEFAPLREWLRTNVHRYGSLLPSADELMAAASGEKLTARHYFSYIRSKYSALLGIPL